MFHSDPSTAISTRRDQPVDDTPDQLCRWVTSFVAADFGLDQAILTGPTRGAPRTAFARQTAMYLAHVCFGLSYDVIGRVFGRDRTTVSHACAVIEDRRDDIWVDCRLATLELICRSVMETGR